MQLFDSTESLAETVAAFLAEGFDRDERLLVVLAPEHWHLIARELIARGYPVAEAMTEGRLVVANAEQTLRECERHGQIDVEAFDATVGTLVRGLASLGGPLRVYGEMVDLLATEGDLRGAQRLEDLWNDLRARVSFVLLCGYSAINFGDPKSATALRRLCAAHSRVHTNQEDRLGSWLVGTTV